MIFECHHSSHLDDIVRFSSGIKLVFHATADGLQAIFFMKFKHVDLAFDSGIYWALLCSITFMWSPKQYPLWWRCSVSGCFALLPSLCTTHWTSAYLRNDLISCVSFSHFTRNGLQQDIKLFRMIFGNIFCGRFKYLQCKEQRSSHRLSLIGCMLKFS